MPRTTLTAAVVATLLVHTTAAASDEQGWQPLLTESTFSEWIDAGASPASYRLEGDQIIGKPIGNNPDNAFLCSPADYHDFELQFSFRIAPASLNSGVQFRSEIRGDGIVAGPQLEMDVQDPADMTFFMRYLADILVRLTDNPWRLQLWPAGGVYGESLPTGWIYPGVAGGERKAFAAQGERLTRSGTWNDLRVLARGPDVKTWLNGELRADYSHPPTDKPGKICLQVHGGEYANPADYEIRWRDLRIRTPGA